MIIQNMINRRLHKTVRECILTQTEPFDFSIIFIETLAQLKITKPNNKDKVREIVLQEINACQLSGDISQDKHNYMYLINAKQVEM